MNITPTVYVISASHNNLSQTRQLLRCLLNQSYHHVKIIFVDDGSTDGTTEYIRKHYPSVMLLSGKGNLWWTGALFAGVQEILKVAKPYDFILTINSDCIIEKNYLSILAAECLRNNRTILGSQIFNVNRKEELVDAGVKIDWTSGRFHITIGNDTDALSTKGTMYPIAVFKQIGYFDKVHFPHYLSDYEFSIRAKRAGFRLRISHLTKVYNDQRKTGIGATIPHDLTIRKAVDLLLSRRSKRNIYDHFWFITLCCPWYLKIHNYILIFLKSLIIILQGIIGTIKSNENS